MKKTGSISHENPNYGTTFSNALNTTKNMILLSLFWMLDIITQTLIEHVNLGHLKLYQLFLLHQTKIYVCYFMYSYAHATFNIRWWNFKSTGFSFCDKFFNFNRGFYGPKCRTIFSSNTCPSSSKLWSSKDLSSFMLTKVYSCQISYHNSCKLSNNFKIMPIKNKKRHLKKIFSCLSQ